MSTMMRSLMESCLTFIEQTATERERERLNTLFIRRANGITSDLVLSTSSSSHQCFSIWNRLNTHHHSVITHQVLLISFSLDVSSSLSLQQCVRTCGLLCMLLDFRCAECWCWKIALLALSLLLLVCLLIPCLSWMIRSYTNTHSYSCRPRRALLLLLSLFLHLLTYVLLSGGVNG